MTGTVGEGDGVVEVWGGWTASLRGRLRGGRLGCVACYGLDGFDASVVSAGRRRRRKMAGTLIFFRWCGGCMYGRDIGMWEVGEWGGEKVCIILFTWHQKQVSGRLGMAVGKLHAKLSDACPR